MWEQTPLRQTHGRLSAILSGAARLYAMLFTVAVIVAAIFPFTAFGQKPANVKPSEDLPSGSMQAKATTSCLECHEARIILQQRLGKAAWAKEVDKMIKWGAVVDPNDHDALIDYLSMNFSPDQPAYDPPRTSTEKPLAKNGEAKRAK
jgi:hypothetical protein